MFFTQDHQYEKVRQSSWVDKNEGEQQNKLRVFLKAFSFVTVGIFISAAIFSTLIILAPTTIAELEKPRSQWTSCGDSPATARARGCSFDILTVAWQTPECFDSSLISDFLAWKDWQWYHMDERNVTIPKEVALQGNQGLAVTWDYHVVHCTFLWRQMHRGYERGWLPDNIRAYGHTLHCQETLLETKIPMEDVVAEGDLIYPTCEWVGDGKSKSKSVYR